MHPDVLTLEQAASLVAIPAAVIRRHAASGRIPGVRIGRPWRFWRPSVLLSVTGASIPHAQHPDLAEVMDAADLGELLGIPERTICTLMRQGLIPGHKVAGRWRTHWPTIQQRLSEGQPLVLTPAPHSVADEYTALAV